LETQAKRSRHMAKVTQQALEKSFYDDLGYWPDVENPRTLQEKLLWRKLREDMSEAVRLADKVAVRDYVREVVGEQYLVEALAIADSADELDFAALPRSFVLKVNHFSGANMLIHDRDQVDQARLRRLVNGLLRLKYGVQYGEHWYSSIPPRILIENVLVDQHYGHPPDYRFHCFHGKAEFLQFVTSKGFSNVSAPGMPNMPAGISYVDRSHALHHNYGMDWQPAPFHFRTSVLPTPLFEHVPALAAEMVAIAEKLAGDWGYVRVDLYCIDDRDIYFSEMTFEPNAGLFGFLPVEYNTYFGDLWDISRRYVRER
jgi:TupA-like ATPgrasp